MDSKEFQKIIDRNTKINEIEANVLIGIFNKMVEKYKLKDFVKEVETKGKNAFTAIIPFISDPDDAANYQSEIIRHF